MSFCLVIGTLFSFTGCSTINTDKNALNQKQVMKIGSKVLTKGDIVNSFYTYYQNNSNYFSYYDEQTIEESFYSWTIIREIINQKAKEALYDPETNTTGVIIFTEEDEKDVREGAFDYMYNQVTAYEKAIYALAGVDSKKYPKWLQTEEKEEEATKFESYVSVKPVVKEEDKKTTADHQDKLSDEDILALVPDVKKRLFQYVVSTDDDGEKTWADMEDYESEDVISYARNEAYAQYMSYLVSNAKSNGKNKSADELFKEEFLRVYNAYYDSQITTMYQNYWLEEYMVDVDEVSLSDKAVVRAYLENYFSDMEKYQIEENYVSVMTSKDGASLVLFNFKGKYYYFTVQHILVKYDEYMTEEISKLNGYSSSNDYDAVVNDVYIAERNELTKNYLMMTEISNEAVEQFKDSISVVGDYYIYDEDAEKTAANKFGYTWLEKRADVVEEGAEQTYSYYYTGGEKYEGDVDEIKYMATEKQVIDCYNNNLSAWEARVGTYITDETKRDEYKTTYESMAYVFDVALNVYNSTSGDNAVKLAAVKEKIASLLWVELQWMYSSDSLGNEISNKMGYVVSSMPDDNGSWVADFAIGARKVLEDVLENRDGKTSHVGYQNTDVNVVTSNYGYHIIKVENIYEAGESLVDMTNFENQMNVNDSDFVAEMVARLKSTYVCTSSNQTLYDYYYDTLYTELAGSSEKSGTYFVALQYKWLAQYLNDDRVEYISKIGYQELMDSMA